MDEVQELSLRLNYIADEQERFTPQNGRLLLPSEIAEIRQAAKALTVSPEKLEAAARAVFRTGFHESEEPMIVDQKWDEWDGDRKAAFAKARAAALALGLKVEG